MTTCHMRCALAMLLTVLGVSALSRADADQKPWHAGNIRAVEAWTQAEQKRHAGSTNVWIARGVISDRAARTVEFVVEATGIEPGAIAEFLAVGETSEKDYEALTVSFARAADICRALDFLGLPRGRPIKPAICQFWPRGEYVQATIRQLGRDGKTGKPLSACLQDKRPGAILPGNLVYVGSCWSGAVCRADEASPGALISTYNEPSVVLDSPGRAPQGEVYGSLVVSATARFDSGTLMVIELTPDPLSNGIPRVVDFSFVARRRDDATGDGLATLACVTRGTEPGFGPATNDVKAALERLATVAKTGRNPFVTVSLDDSMTVGAARDLARVFAMVDGDGGLRIEAPSAGQLYYKAFLPDERWRPRIDRPSQPWELRVARNKQGAWVCTLVQILEDWSKEGQLTPDLTPTDFPLTRPEELPGKIRERVEAQVVDVKQKLARAGKPASADTVDELAMLKRINTIFVFAPTDAPLGTFLPAVRLVHGTLPQVHVFVEQ